SFTISLDSDLSGMKTDALPEEIRNIVEIIKDANFYIDEKILYLMPYKFPEKVK
ncbi:MAG: hypothetical protein ISS28_06140, partial [Candidatus Cloacimonetes bacterium]|nr:hypothetical protein [Candidatus Cloacimonadota bacterium]